MAYYHVAQICLNGHMVNDTYDTQPEFNQPFCSKCGAKTITTCPHCGAVLHGELECGVISLGTAPVQSYCYNCGNPYPWTESALEAITLMIQEDEKLSASERQNLEQSLPDILSETPKTKVASIRIKKAILSAGKFTADALRQFVIDFGCELAKKSLGL